MRTISEILKEVDKLPNRFMVDMAKREIKANAPNYSMSEYAFAIEYLDSMAVEGESDIPARSIDMGLGGIIQISVQGPNKKKINAAYERGKFEGLCIGIAITAVTIAIAIQIFKHFINP